MKFYKSISLKNYMIAFFKTCQVLQILVKICFSYQHLNKICCFLLLIHTKPVNQTNKGTFIQASQ